MIRTLRIFLMVSKLVFVSYMYAYFVFTFIFSHISSPFFLSLQPLVPLVRGGLSCLIGRSIFRCVLVSFRDL